MTRYDNMQYAPCPGTGVSLPKVSLGLWHNFGDDTPYERSRQIALTAFDLGITHFDLANNYGPPPGEAERRLGKLLATDLASHRDELFLSTKAAYDMWPGPYGSGASRKHLIASLDQSLRRAGLDYFDLFYCHRYDPLTPLDETLQALADIVRAGKALYIGISRWPAQALARAIPFLASRHVPMLIYQGRLNILDRAPSREGILSLLAVKRKAFISFSPLAQGLLTDRYLHGIPADSRMAQQRFLKSTALTPSLLASLQALNAIAARRGETLAQMALAWALQQPQVTSVLVGASSPQQLMDNVRCLGRPPFTPEELALIDSAALPA